MAQFTNLDTGDVITAEGPVADYYAAQEGWAPVEADPDNEGQVVVTLTGADLDAAVATAIEAGADIDPKGTADERRAALTALANQPG